MTSTRRLAVSYSRFSDPKQARGDSARRQAEMFRQFCTRHNLTPLKDAYIDEGRSGYHDAHRKKGRLGQLIALAKAGHFEPGTVIVIEAWDRLGRLRPDKQTELLAELLRTGVCVGVCRLDDIFSEEDFGTHKWTTLAVFVQLAYQESKQKAERISASYEERRKLARECKKMPPRKADGRASRLLTDRLPFWLEASGDYCRPIPEREAAVKRIFRLAAEGLGRSRIVAALKAEGIPPFGVKKWTRSYLNKLLSDRRVCGDYQPRRTDDKADGAVIVGYYPRVVSEEEWLLARAGQEKRRGKDRRGRALARTERKYVNLFRGLLTSATDGEGFFLHQKVEAGKRRAVLCNLAGPGGHAKTVTFPYAVFEEAVLDLLSEVNPRDVLPKKAGPARADVLRARLKAVREDLAGLKEDLKGSYSKALADVLRAKEAEEEATADALQEELARTARPAEASWRDLPGLAEQVRKGGDEARLRLRAVLRRVVEDARVLIVRRGCWQLCAVQFFFAGGAARSYVIANQAAANHRPGKWWAGSLGPDEVPAGLDLRQPEHADRLARRLAEADLDKLAGA